MLLSLITFVFFLKAFLTYFMDTQFYPEKKHFADITTGAKYSSKAVAGYHCVNGNSAILTKESELAGGSHYRLLCLPDKNPVKNYLQKH